MVGIKTEIGNEGICFSPYIYFKGPKKASGHAGRAQQSCPAHRYFSGQSLVLFDFGSYDFNTPLALCARKSEEP